jgi:hypothetical protein
MVYFLTTATIREASAIVIIYNCFGGQTRYFFTPFEQFLLFLEMS